MEVGKLFEMMLAPLGNFDASGYNQNSEQGNYTSEKLIDSVMIMKYLIQGHTIRSQIMCITRGLV